ncbi:MAG: methylenetetrahydrofolate reductase C-terminal domain-containing protein [Deltaproteobacteria bacterium]|nr:methylenetetrahydrofolate reductase C-terminal domain-containing protein [Deltaproteobacteria bacterium]
MIIAEGKPIQEILAMIAPYDRIILAGCKGCVTVCSAGGEKEVGILASALRLARRAEGRALEVKEITLERQCDTEYLEPLQALADGYPVLLSLACGAGIQFLAEKFLKHPVLPGVNTQFIGVTEEQGVWTERCQACGECVLDRTGGICPVARCSKSLFNGPCGGSKGGKCEIDSQVDCGWQLIYDRLKGLGQLEKLEIVLPAKSWSASRDGGPRKRIREDLRL